ncbi:hypothetical protein [Colwellia hornerae]|uniref:Uncharacterized protein n=2 Tax=Colwellia hornerae TaxID=89402 RepID=A0A5C6QK20_9GAMM|nr:hypothetical protein [Colwellia hornerae]TWX54076.1 hypothetical protein ESZ28_08475 [Colwellia hornerae]TWX60851.1 hypothetical protein ESZ26_07250 [Colwellia hornerae]TWX69181.1 hypothetical protein ESZ27_06010 [Colwellia hornerae]
MTELFFSIPFRHAEFISVSGLRAVNNEILKRVQDDGVWAHVDGILSSRHAEFISVSELWVVNNEILKQVQDDGVWAHVGGGFVQDDGCFGPC